MISCQLITIIRKMLLNKVSAC